MYRVVGNLVIVPNRDPRELLVASYKIQVSAISREPPSVIIESEDLVVWLRDTTNTVAPTIVAVLVLVDVISEMHDIVDGILVRRSA